MKALKKCMFLLTAGLILASSAGCSKPSNTPASGASGNSASQTSDAPAELTWLVSGDNTPPDTNTVLQKLCEETNTKLSVTYVSGADEASKLNTLIASKSLPDVFQVTTISDAEQIRDNGMAAELTEYLKDAENIQNELGSVLGDSPVNKDGKMYSVFSAAKPYAQNMCIRTDWLKAVNKEMPTDLDSLYDVLYAFTYNDPDGNGENDTIGLGASIVGGWNNFIDILGAYGIASSGEGLRPIELEDGTVTTGLKHENFLDAVAYFRKLYQDGLMDPDFVTIPAMDSYGKLWNGKVGAFDFQCPGPTNNWMPSRYVEDPPPTFDFAAIAGPDGAAAQGKQYVSYVPATMVSAQCKDVAAAVRVLDYLMSPEGSLLTYLGVEGVHYKWADEENGKYEMVSPYDDSTTNRNDGVYVYSEFLLPENTAERRLLNEQTREGVAMGDEMSTIEWPYIYTSFEAETMYGSTLKNIEKEIFCQLITTTGDVQEEYEAGIARWEAEGGLQWEAGATEAYKSQQK